jgi:hypothetical protein
MATEQSHSIAASIWRNVMRRDVTVRLQAFTQSICYIDNIDIEFPNFLDPDELFERLMSAKTTTSEDETNPVNEKPEEGFVTCKRCKSRRVFWRSSHCRSMDEGSTVFFTCSECDKRWAVYA